MPLVQLPRAVKYDSAVAFVALNSHDTDANIKIARVSITEPQKRPFLHHLPPSLVENFLGNSFQSLCFWGLWLKYCREFQHAKTTPFFAQILERIRPYFNRFIVALCLSL